MAKRDAAGATDDTSGGRGGVRGFLRETAIVVVGALIASTLLRMFLVQVFVIPSRSMEDTLLVGDRVAAQKVVGFERGDIVVFADDLEWLGPPREDQLAWWQAALTFIGLLPDEGSNRLIKRVVGMPGDHVVCCDVDGRVTVNGTALDEDPYLYRDPGTGEPVAASDFAFDVVVPAGRIFVMGDHRDNSADSRCHLAESRNGVQGAAAFVSAESVVGVAALTVFPFDRLGTLPRPATYAGVAPPPGPAPPSPVVTGEIPHC